MASRAFEGIKAGLEEALGVAAGDTVGSRRTLVSRPEPDVRALREGLGMSQAEFAAAFGVSVGTVRNWEQGRREPQGPARVLLAVIEREPEAVKRALSTAA